MEPGGEKKIGVEVEEELELIDITTEDDFLIDFPFRDSPDDLRLSVILENYEIFRNSNSPKAENEAEVLEQRVHFSLPDLMQPRRSSFLRKSLAWDSAFFTSAGVLDPDELSIVNKGFQKAEVHSLPGLREDLWAWKSAGSEPTLLDGDGFFVENSEVNLFEDIRASIDKIRNIFNVPSARWKSGFGQAGTKKTLASKKFNVISKNREKSLPASKRQSVRLQGPEKVQEDSVNRSQMLQHPARSGESTRPFGKVPKILGHVNPISAKQTKRALHAPYCAKTGNKTAKIGSRQDAKLSKTSGSGDSHSVYSTTCHTPLPKSFSSVSCSATKNSIGSCSSTGTPASVSSYRYPSNSMRKKVSSRNKKVGSSDFSIHSSLMSSHSSCTSPNSSFDLWSSESLSSASTCSLDIATLQKLDFQSYSKDQFLTSEGIQDKRFTVQCTERETRGTNPVSAESTKRVKPSCLRMPSPKIGFFDEDKSTVPTSRGDVQFQHSHLPDSGRAMNKKVLRKLQRADTLPQTANVRLGSQQTGRQNPALCIRPKYARLHGLDNASPEVSGTLRTIRNCSGTEAQSFPSPAVDLKSRSKTRSFGAGEHDRKKVGLTSRSKGVECDRRKVGLSRSLQAESRTKQISQNEMGKKSKRDDSGVQTEASDPSKKENDEASGHRLENNLQKNKHRSITELDDQDNELSRYFEVIDLSKDVVIELQEKPGHSTHQVCDNYPEDDQNTPTSSFFERKHLPDQQDFPKTFWKPSHLSRSTTTQIIPQTRTPLMDKTSIWNKSGSFTKRATKASIFPASEGSDKENS